jgi:hypothetical protein
MKPALRPEILIVGLLQQKNKGERPMTSIRSKAKEVLQKIGFPIPLTLANRS